MTLPSLLNRMLSRSADRNGAQPFAAAELLPLEERRLDLLELSGPSDFGSLLWLLDRRGLPTPPPCAAR